MLLAFLYAKGPRQEAVIVEEKGGEAGAMLKALQQEFLPHTVSLHISPEHAEIKKIAPFLQGYTAAEGTTAAYICQNRACRPPVTDPAEFKRLLNT